MPRKPQEKQDFQSRQWCFAQVLPMAGTVWDEVLGRIETKVNRYSFYAWFKQTSFDRDDGTTINVRVADPSVVGWLTKRGSGRRAAKTAWSCAGYRCRCGR